MKKSVVGMFLVVGVAVWGAAPEESCCFASPDANAIRAHVDYLCNDACEGRSTHTQGEKVSSAYIAKHYETLGLKPLQPGGFGEATVYHQPWSTSDVGWQVEPPAWDTQPLAKRWWQNALTRLDARAFSCNVCGMQEGCDGALKGEYIVVCAHYDHLGKEKEGIYRGADDNASGTAVVMEVARMLTQTPMKRSVIYLACSGEEMGRLGSSAFLNRAPMKAQIIASINLDMLGRNEPDRLHVAPVNTDPVVSTLTRDVRAIGTQHGFQLSAGLDAKLTDSDQFSFLLKKIPSLFFHTGLHDDYHTVKDTPEKLDYKKMAKVAAIVGDLVTQTANAPQSPSILPQSEWSTWTWGPYRFAGEGSLWGAPRAE